MTIGFIYWLILLLWLLFGLYNGRTDLAGGNLLPFGGNLILFVLFFLLGWSCFGWPIKG